MNDDIREAGAEFKLSDEEWAELNTQRYQENEASSYVLGFEHEGAYITNPFMDPSYRFEVDPEKEYGSNGEWFLKVLKEKRRNHALAMNSNS